MRLFKINLFYCEGSHNKVYNVQVEQSGPGYVVRFQYGRRGATLNDGTKTQAPVDYDTAVKIYKKLVAEKTGKGYTDDPSGTPGTFSGNVEGSGAKAASYASVKKVVTGNIPQLLNVIEESEVEGYLMDEAYGVQEKHDGKHMILKSCSGDVTASNKKGIGCGFPEVFKASLPAMDLLIDGEAIGESFKVWDILELSGENFRDNPYIERHKILSRIKFGPAITVSVLAVGRKAKRAMYEDLVARKREGIVFKRLDARHVPGRPASGGNQLKHKFYAEASVIVVKGREGKRSFGMEVIDSGKRVFVGNCSVPANKLIPAIGSVTEIKYLYAHKGGSLYQPFYKELRDDISIDECVISQLKYKSEED